jgi:hypothetical protein
VLAVVLARRGGPAPTTRPAIVASASADAGLSTGTIELVTDPAGAQAFVDGAAVGVTPTHAQVAAGRAVGVRLVLAGHRSYEDTITVRPGQVYALQRQLVVAPARLHVESTPPGATVSLAGAVLGTTPLTRIDLAPGRGTLELERAGYERHREGVELIADGELRRTVELVAVQRTGAIDLHIDDGWADIFLRGKKVGRAPIKGCACRSAPTACAWSTPRPAARRPSPSRSRPTRSATTANACDPAGTPARHDAVPPRARTC